MKQKRIKFTELENWNTHFIFTLPNGKTKSVDKERCICFQRINAGKHFHRQQPATVAGMMHLNMFNCDFPTNYYCVLTES